MRHSLCATACLTVTLALCMHASNVAAARYDDRPAAQADVSFVKHIKPFLAKYCMECHNEDDADSGFVVETYETLLDGGERGASLVPGDPDASRLVLMLEGKAKPKMPPKNAANQPKADEIGLVRAWVAAGAKNDTADAADPRPALPAIQPRATVAPRITTAAYRPDNSVLAVSAYNEVLLLHPTDGTVLGKLTEHADAVTALAWSRDGRRLAVATGAAGERGELHIYQVPIPLVIPADLKPDKTLAAHGDLIHAIDLSSDGKFAATCSYDKLVKLWNPETGSEVATLKDHSDAVYGVAFSPDDRLLASVAADRAVKVWEVVSGRRLYTLGEPTDWVYAVAWSPNGKYLAAAGVDKSIRVWEATVAGGRIVHSTFAHDGPITRLVYAADSKTLFSLSDDRSVKAWDTAQMIERAHFEPLSEILMALAVSGDGKQLAVGRFDGVVEFFDAASGDKLREPLAVAHAKRAPKPEPPVLTAISPRGAQRGRTIQILFDGKNLNHATEVAFSGSESASRMSARIVQDGGSGTTPQQSRADVTVPPDMTPGVVRVSLKYPAGSTAELPFAITAYPEILEAGANESRATAATIALPATLVGSLDRAGDTDYYRFEIACGQQLGIEVVANEIGSKLEPVLTLIDQAGQVLAETAGPFLGHTFEQAGSCVLRIRDVDYRGSGEMFYRASVGDVPIITDVFPLGLARGSEIDVKVRGVNLGGVKSVKVQAAENAQPDSRVPLQIPLDPLATRGSYPAPLNSKSLVVGDLAEVVEQGANEAVGASTVPTPVTINGSIERPLDADLFRFQAKRGEPLIVDVRARRLGSPLDSFVELLDSQGEPLQRATLRCLAKTYTVFRDHDSVSPGIRIEDWRELAINDHILINNELARIWALPRNPDDDCQFMELRGQRTGYLDTTPAHVPMGTPIYKVSLHPPGMRFPPNGMPVISIPFRNDDGGPQYGKDSRLFFDPPADGEYLVRIGDVRGHGGPSHAYRLAIRPPKPDYKVSFSPTAPAVWNVWKGGAIPVAIACERFDGFDGAIDVRLEDLPTGFSAPVTTIPAGENSTSLALFADREALPPASDSPKIKLVARATIDGKDRIHQVAGGQVSLVDPGDIVTTVEQSEVAIEPGHEAKLTVRIERRNDFKGRIPIEVRGLPHGTRVLDIGLNGILITERETSRVITLYSEPWSDATNHPFVVLAKREGTNTEHAARSVLLRVLSAPSAAATPAEPN